MPGFDQLFVLGLGDQGHHWILDRFHGPSVSRLYIMSSPHEGVLVEPRTD
jgi:hypothetical protein